MGDGTMGIMNPEELLDALDPDQRAVATQVAGPVAVLAGAGTGKTRAITAVHRVELPPQLPENRVPLLGDVAAGAPILAQECVEEYVPFDTNGEDCFALRIRGESMLKAGILPGDLVIVRRQETAVNGEIVIALIGDEATCKRYSRKNGHVWLLPENDDYQPIDGTFARILGKVVGLQRRY